MMFVDTNVYMYAVGREHPLREEAREFFVGAAESGEVLVSSAEVLQELMHAYLPVNRIETLDAALELARGRLASVWAVEREDVELARSLRSIDEDHPFAAERRRRGLEARLGSAETRQPSGTLALNQRPQPFVNQSRLF